MCDFSSADFWVWFSCWNCRRVSPGTFCATQPIPWSLRHWSQLWAITSTRTRLILPLVSNETGNFMTHYWHPISSLVGWDNIQETYKCCGLETAGDRFGYQDWVEEVGGIPLSCCEIPHATLNNFTCDKDQETMHQPGCVQAFGDFIKSHALSLALVGIILAAIQLIGLLFACLIARQIKKNRGFWDLKVL